MAETGVVLAAKFEAIFPHLDERQRRLLMGAEAGALGHGGIRVVARAAGAGEATVSLGVRELEAGQGPLGRARREGGGRKRLADTDPGLVPALLALVEPDERGDPMSPLRWTTKSTRKLAAELTRQGHRAGADTVGDLLRAQGFSLQGNAKTIEGARHRDRDAQFGYLNERARRHRDGGQPVVSVDTKKKEQIGEFASAGREWRPAGDPVRVRDHDFPDKKLGKAVPYGVYDLAAGTGWVNVGTGHDTAAFAVESVRRWWRAAGAAAYPGARKLLITADAGGSNGYRTRAWKTGLAALAAETGLQITVCHFPPGTSKWNKIEHRLFSHITMNWRGRPLTSHDVIVNTIAATTTRTGLTVRAELDTGLYPAGIKISDQQMAALPITPHHFHGDWNYTLHPHPPTSTGQAPDTAAAPPTGSPPPPARPPRCGQATLSHPALTGMPPQALAALAAALTIPWHAHHEQKRYTQRGGPRRTTPRTSRPRLDVTDHLLATLLHLRLHLPCQAIAALFGADRTTVSHAVTLTRQLLHQHGTTIQPAPTRLRTLGDLYQHAAAAGITLPPELKPAC
jgi:Rhodopirellula transposase DDE domain/Helix-turn-helix of DDE superfamily endonuclease